MNAGQPNTRKANAALIAGLLTLSLGAAVGGYWLGTRSASGHDIAAPTSRSEVSPGTPEKKARKLLYYRNPMGLADTSQTPKKDPMGMDYIAVYEGEDDADPAAAGRHCLQCGDRRAVAGRVDPAGPLHPRRDHPHRAAHGRRDPWRGSVPLSDLHP